MRLAKKCTALSEPRTGKESWEGRGKGEREGGGRNRRLKFSKRDGRCRSYSGQVPFGPHEERDRCTRRHGCEVSHILASKICDHRQVPPGSSLEETKPRLFLFSLKFPRIDPATKTMQKNQRTVETSKTMGTRGATRMFCSLD